MNISYNWLKKYLSLPASVTPEQVAEKLKFSTVEVEGVIKQGADLENIVVGKVLACEKHPNADKLQVCEVDLGSEKVQIVCGGSNVRVGMFTVVAKVGAKVRWHGEGELVELAPAKIRGVESFGMICGADEVGLAEMFPKKDEKEIVDLSVILSEAKDPSHGERDSSAMPQNDKCAPGTNIGDIIGGEDVVLEIDNKSLSNRPDLWGHYGIAREVSALFNCELKEYKTKKIKGGSEMKIDVDVQDAKLCPRYMAVAMKNIKVGESPAWLKNFLTSAGIRPINNIVDVTNFVMLDLGQPMHSFDAARVKNSKFETLNYKIVVRSAVEGEELITLDEQKHKLTASDLLIATPDKAVALAGVMGGLESGINNDTETIILESANFNPVAIRRVSTRLGLRTDSSMRFEKSLDPNLCAIALNRAVELILELCPGATVVSAVADEYEPLKSVADIQLPIAFFRAKIGIEIPEKTILEILTRLGFAVKMKKDILTVKVPSWRATKDISIPEDIVEEVVRIFGYNNIPFSLPFFSIESSLPNPLRTLERQVADILCQNLSYTEVYNYSFVSANQIEKLGDELSRYLELDNPISKEKPYLRRNLLPNMLENIANNISQVDGLKIFEIGKVFHEDEMGEGAGVNDKEILPRQDTYVTAMFTQKKNSTPFWEARRVAETIGASLHLDFDFASADARPVHVWQHGARTSWLKIGGKIVGRIYEINPRVTMAYGISERVALCALNLSELANLDIANQAIKYAPINNYPAIERDLAFLVKNDITHTAIMSEIRNIDPLLQKVNLFDVYEGKNIGKGMKSMAYHFVYGDADRTLTAPEADAIQEKIVSILREKFNAEIRG